MHILACARKISNGDRSTLDPDQRFDYKTTLWFYQMGADYTGKRQCGKAGSNRRHQEGFSRPSDHNTVDRESGKEMPLSTDKEIGTFSKNVEKSLQDHLKVPDDVQQMIKDKHFKTLKGKFSIEIGQEDGSIKKLEMTELAETDSLNTALQKAINGAAPFEDPSRTKEGIIPLTVKIIGDKIKVERQ